MARHDLPPFYGPVVVPLGSVVVPLGSDVVPFGSDVVPLGSDVVPFGSDEGPLGSVVDSYGRKPKGRGQWLSPKVTFFVRHSCRVAAARWSLSWECIPHASREGLGPHAEREDYDPERFARNKETTPFPRRTNEECPVPYDMQIDRANPGCIVFLVDLSNSMLDGIAVL